MRNIVVTGGASGIGLAICRRFAEAGDRVFLLDFNQVAGESVREELRMRGYEVSFHQVNVANHTNVEKVFSELPGTLDVLVNNAGISHIGNLGNTKPEDFDRLYEVNVKGVFACAQAALPKLLANKNGVILNMCSIAATIGLQDRFAYSMTKGAVLSMTLSIARDYVHQNIRCNCISPGRVHTPFVDGFLAKNYPGKEKEMFEKLSASQPIGRMGQPEEIAAMIFYLASREASFITGTNFPIDGGFLGLKM